jgi:integrase
MDRRGVGERGSGMFVKRVRVAAAACGWSSPADMRYDQAAEYLAATRKERGWAGNTTDGVVSALRCFSRFCHAAGLVGMDPFLQLNRSGEQGGPGDRALTVAEVRSLITVAAATTARDRRSKCPRGLYYGFLALTGLRTIEAEKCTWGDVDLDAEIPSIWSDPSWSKNGQRQRVCLCPEIVEKLREWRRCVPNGRKDLVFPQVPNRATWIKDRVAAEIPEVDARGRRAGMHGLRKAFATWLYETGASDATISRLLRHGATLAQKTYVDPAPTLEVEAVNRLPKIFDGVQVSVYAGLTPTMPKMRTKPLA